MTTTPELNEAERAQAIQAMATALSNLRADWGMPHPEFLVPTGDTISIAARQAGTACGRKRRAA